MNYICIFFFLLLLLFISRASYKSSIYIEKYYSNLEEHKEDTHLDPYLPIDVNIPLDYFIKEGKPLLYYYNPHVWTQP